MNWIGLKLEPLDTLFCRDGRPFAAASRVESGLPSPQTLAGALRTALLTRAGIRLHDLARLRRADQLDVRAALDRLAAPAWILDARFRGPWLALEAGSRVDPLLPVPAVLARQEPASDDDSGVWSRARPLPPGHVPGWPSRSDLPLWRLGNPDSKYPGGFLTTEGVRRFLQGSRCDHRGLPTDEHWHRAGQLFAHDDRIGIAVDPHTFTAGEGLIYGIRLLALARGVCLYAEMLPGGEPPSGPLFDASVPLGGEGRQVGVSVVAAHQWPEAEGECGLWLLATPAPARGAWPEGLAHQDVAAAASEKPVTFSGWDVARGGPHPTRFAVPAGSVYFFNKALPPGPGCLCADKELADQGWGVALRGTWTL